MCANSARLMDTLECFMDDLVDCFEDFIKKSLIVISLAVGALIVMLGYVLKIISERSHGPHMCMQRTQGVYRTEANIANISATNSLRSNFQDHLLKPKCCIANQKSANSIAMPCLRKGCKRTTSASVNTNPLSSMPSFDEKVLRNIGLSSCSNSCIQGQRSVMRNCSASSSRLTIPSMPTCIPNHHISTPRPCTKFIENRNSCCSMCCADDDRRSQILAAQNCNVKSHED